MHKTITVTIGGALFVIEEQAYKLLENYLAAIRTHFATYPEQGEIVSDIEDRIAEEFGEKLSARKKTINEKDVEELIKNMGTVEDFREFEGAGRKGEESGEKNDAQAPFGGPNWNFSGKGRLFRSSDDQVIGGVCAGIGSYLNLDPWIVRIVFIVLGVAHGVGILLYIVLWAMLPEAKTATEKVEMVGGKVTLSAIQQKIEETMPKEKRETLFRKIISVPVIIVRTAVTAIGRVLSVVVPLVGRVIGAFMAVGAAIGIAFTLFVTLAVLVNPGSPYIGIPVHDIIPGPLLYALAASFFMIAFVPLLFFVVLGASLMTMRSAFSGQAIVAMLTFWLIALVTMGLTLFSAGPVIEAAFDQMRSEDQSSVTLNAKDFTEINAGWNTVVNVSKGPFSVKATGSEEVIRGLNPNVAPDGALSIERSPSSHDRCILFCRSHDRLTLDISMPTLSAVRANDVSRVSIEGLSGSGVLLQSMGASRIDASMEAGRMEAFTSEIGHVTLSGKARMLDATAEGNSRIDAAAFSVTDAQVKASGISRVSLKASGNVSGSAHDNSRVEYYGSPASVDVDTDDISRIERLDGDEE